MTSPHDQSQYQVRFDWGLGGAAAMAPDADVVVVVDVLNASGSLLDGYDWPLTCAVVAGSLRNRAAIAEWVLARQAERGTRISVAILAAGDVRADGSIRFAVEDELGAGAIIDALATLGIDYCSPEAAAACASFTGLTSAIRHLVSASASARELTDGGKSRDVALAAEVDSSSNVHVVKEFSALR
ncbi:MAG: 2-phosphosulfolactate phosphatase [Cryobacterium sp.]|nr:2-phosphosulfolactate phosphatase [Cryobacterium sp.]